MVHAWLGLHNIEFEINSNLPVFNLMLHNILADKEIVASLTIL